MENFGSEWWFVSCRGDGDGTLMTKSRRKSWEEARATTDGEASGSYSE